MEKLRSELVSFYYVAPKHVKPAVLDLLRRLPTGIPEVLEVEYATLRRAYALSITSMQPGMGDVHANRVIKSMGTSRAGDRLAKML
jgi:hypothetical protein